MAVGAVMAAAAAGGGRMLEGIPRSQKRSLRKPKLMTRSCLITVLEGISGIALAMRTGWELHCRHHRSLILTNVQVEIVKG
jgi:hypothetical protein